MYMLVFLLVFTQEIELAIYSAILPQARHIILTTNLQPET